MTTTLRLILGDQLNAEHSWFQSKDDQVVYLVAEVLEETHYVTHHIQKLVAFFIAMQRFADALKAAGHRVIHLTLDETHEFASFTELIVHQVETLGITQLEWLEPDEFRLQEQLNTLPLPASVTSRSVDSEHFYLSRADIAQYFPKGKAKQMEAFYRSLRKRFDILMEGEQPLGGRWNYDHDNRQKLKAADIDAIPAPLTFTTPTQAVLERLQRHGVASIGQIESELLWPTSREEANALLEYFCTHCLAHFGRFQDAMTHQSKHQWSLYHSRLSFALNSKMISPQHVVNRAIAEQRSRSDDINLAQVEGFVRQILGWREFMRGIYWANMPEYATLNALNATRPVPHYYWSGQTKMLCMASAIKQSLDYAYAHHIQRLMVTGNFALLAGLAPEQVDEWYLGIYIDAIEWVELPNTRGMSQYADGGIVGSKPYISGGAYINKMSDYCGACHYSVKQRTGEQSCPFNSLYWHFLTRHRASLGRNQRLAMPYRTWDKMDDDTQASILNQAERTLANLESL